MTKILLVEDDKNLREIYGVRLLAEGYQIVTAGDGEEALAMAIKESPDLIVSDVMMPKVSGFDMLDILRSTAETRNIKVIMMTALSSEDQRRRGEMLGADKYLVKSQVGIEDVVKTVKEILGTNNTPVVNDQNTEPLNNNFISTPQPAAMPQQTVQPNPAINREEMPTVNTQSMYASRQRPTVSSAPSHASQNIGGARRETVNVGRAPIPNLAGYERIDRERQTANGSINMPYQSTLPKPVAPFSSDRPKASAPSRTIEDIIPPRGQQIAPLENSIPNQDMSNLINKALNE